MCCFAAWPTRNRAWRSRDAFDADDPRRVYVALLRAGGGRLSLVWEESLRGVVVSVVEDRDESLESSLVLAVLLRRPTLRSCAFFAFN